MGKESSKVFCKLRTDVGEVFRVVVQRYRFQLFRGLKSSVHLVAYVELVQVMSLKVIHFQSIFLIDFYLKKTDLCEEM